MNSYIVKLLQVLLSNHGQIEISSIMKELGITKRMFLYYRKQLNEYLLHSQLPQVLIKNDIIFLEDIDNKNLMNLLISEVPLEAYILNAEERQDCILIEIGISECPVKLESLIESFHVSRNTIINDLANIKKYLATVSVRLLNNSKSGYYLDGDELLIRYLIMNAYHKRDNMYIDEYKKKTLLTHLPYYGVNDSQAIEKVQEILIESEHLANENFIFLALPDLSQTMLLMYMRSAKARVYLQIEHGLEKNRRMLNFIIEKISDLHMMMDEEQTTYLYLILQAAKISSMDEWEYEEEVITLAQSIIQEFEAVSQVDIAYQKQLVDMFLLHVKSMYYRTRYKIKITDFQEIGTEEHQGFYYITQNVMNNISQRFNLFVDQDEIRFLSYYFSCLEHKQRITDESKIENIVVVCVSGLGSSVYLKHQLTKLFENVIPVIISDIRNMNNRVSEYTKLIVTTMDLDDKFCKGKSIIKVNTLLTQANKRELLEWFLNDNIQNKETMIVHDVIDIIKSYTIIQNQEKLFQQLNQYFYAETHSRKELQLQDVIAPQYICIYDKVNSWKDMIYLAGAPLLQANLIKKTYLDDIVNVIEQYGLYCECLNGILVAHAKPDHNVVQPILSLAVFHQPLVIDKWQKTITGVFILGVIDKESHAHAFSQLITTLSQAELYRHLHEFTSVQELYSKLIEVD